VEAAMKKIEVDEYLVVRQCDGRYSVVNAEYAHVVSEGMDFETAEIEAEMLGESESGN
jgi:hypothetical protein